MLQPADLRGAATSAVRDGDWIPVRPPLPGGADLYPSIELRQSGGAVSATVVVGAAPTVVVEYVATFRSNGARRYLRDLRRALDRDQWVDDSRWVVLAAGLAVRQSLLLRLREVVVHAGETRTKDTYAAVARVGRVVVVVASPGWRPLTDTAQWLRT
jgi:hypothetical protein